MSGFAQKIAVVSIRRRINSPEDMNFNDLYQAIGLNTGNLMFTNAIFRQIKGEIENVGFYFIPERVNEEFDALIIPAANWINSTTDWSWFIALLEKITIPIVTIGIGVQAPDTDLEKVKVSESGLRLARLLSSSARWISCRGNFTRDWLESIGIHNGIVTGCPSTYMKLKPVDSVFTVDQQNVVLQGTRYWLDSGFIDGNCINRNIYGLAGEFNLPMIYQSEAEEIDYLIYDAKGQADASQKKMAALCRLYGKTTEVEVQDFLNINGKVFFDIDEWSGYLRNQLGVIGTRLHGALLALNSGRPARLISHDSRTHEVAEFSGIPTLRDDDLVGADPALLRSILNDTDVERYVEKRNKNSIIYRQFLTECNLRVNQEGFIR